MGDLIPNTDHGGQCPHGFDMHDDCDVCDSEQRDAEAEPLREQVAALTARVAALEARVGKAEEVVTQARQLTAYDWESRLDDSETSDDAKRDSRELSIAVWHYDRSTESTALSGGTSALDAALAQARAEGEAEGRAHGLLAAAMVASKLQRHAEMAWAVAGIGGGEKAFNHGEVSAHRHLLLSVTALAGEG